MLWEIFAAAWFIYTISCFFCYAILAKSNHRQALRFAREENQATLLIVNSAAGKRYSFKYTGLQLSFLASGIAQFIWGFMFFRFHALYWELSIGALAGSLTGIWIRYALFVREMKEK